MGFINQADRTVGPRLVPANISLRYSSDTWVILGLGLRLDLVGFDW